MTISQYIGKNTVIGGGAHAREGHHGTQSCHRPFGNGDTGFGYAASLAAEVGAKMCAAAIAYGPVDSLQLKVRWGLIGMSQRCVRLKRDRRRSLSAKPIANAC